MSAKTRPCKTCGKNRSEKFFVSPQGRVCLVCQRDARRTALRTLRLKNVYELEAEEYQKLYDAQDGKCACCGEQRTYLLHVEHDHKIERLYGVRASIRGLCCKRCNGLLRDGHDNAELFRMLARYLDNPPAQHILQAA